MHAAESAAARRRMVDSQLKPNRVTDPRILDTMGSLPREAFLPHAMASVAYMDEDLPIGGGRYLMEPMVFARMVQAADIDPTDVILDIGSAGGYSAAVLCRLGGTVVALESDPKLLAEAQGPIAKFACDTVALVEGPLQDGYPSQAPFNVIVIEGAVPEVPEAILQQMADGGRLVAVVRTQASGRAMLYKRSGGLFSHRILFDAATPPLPGFAKAEGFVF